MVKVFLGALPFALLFDYIAGRFYPDIQPLRLGERVAAIGRHNGFLWLLTISAGLIAIYPSLGWSLVFLYILSGESKFHAARRTYVDFIICWIMDRFCTSGNDVLRTNAHEGHPYAQS